MDNLTAITNPQYVMYNGALYQFVTDKIESVNIASFPTESADSSKNKEENITVADYRKNVIRSIKEIINSDYPEYCLRNYLDILKEEMRESNPPIGSNAKDA